MFCSPLTYDCCLGSQINEAAFHQARLLLDIEAGSPIILIPHSSQTTDVLVADLGRLSVHNCFKLDGADGTFTAQMRETQARTPTQGSSESLSMSSKQAVSRSTSRTSQRSFSNSSSQGETPKLKIKKNGDPMQQSVYGSLEEDLRYVASDDNMDDSDIGSSVDPQSPGPSPRASALDVQGQRSRTSLGSRSDVSGLDLSTVPDIPSPVTVPDPKKTGLNVFLSEAFNTKLFTTNTEANVFPDASFSTSERTIQDNDFSQVTSPDDVTMETEEGPCLLDVMDVRLSDMDLFSAERVEKSAYDGDNLRQDLEFPSCVIQRKVSSCSFFS